MQVDTIGSAIDTVLAVYRGSSILDIREVACNDDGAPDGIRSLLQFNGVANADYLLAVDGAGGTKGNISLNWRCGSAPTVSPPPFTNANVRLGGTLQLSNSVFSHTPDLAYQWRLNGGNIAGQTNALLRIFNLTAGQAGNYTVVVRNFAGSVTSQVVTVRFALGVPLGHGFDGPRFRVTGPAGQEYVIQATTNLLSWDPVFTNSSTTLSPINWTDLNSPLFSNRLYRVVPWP